VRCTAIGLLLALGVLLVRPDPAHAQAWTQPKGGGYAKLSLSSVTASDRYTFDGRAVEYSTSRAETPFRDRSAYLYAEAGVTDDVTLVLNVPYKYTTIEGSAFRYQTRGFGTVRVGGRYDLDGLIEAVGGPNQLAVNAGVRLPVGYTRNLRPSAGPGQVDLELTVDYGRSLHPLPLYAQAGAGFRYRSGWYGLSTATSCPASAVNCLRDQTSDLGDEWIASAEVGATPFDGAVLVQALARTVWSVDPPTTSFLATNPVPQRRRFVKAGGGVTIYPARIAGLDVLQSLGIGVQAYWTPSGRNTVRSRDVFVGIEYTRRP
jgi:hypothetical protein